MESAFESETAHRFASELHDKAQQCDQSGSGFQGLSEKIAIFIQLCEDLRAFINQWSKSIFRGDSELDSGVEELLKGEIRDLLARAKQVAAAGRGMAGDCYVLPELDRLHYRIADLDFLAEHWVTPRLAVSPAPRVKLSPKQVEEMKESIRALSKLPADWLPEDAEQRARLLEQRQQAAR